MNSSPRKEEHVPPPARPFPKFRPYTLDPFMVDPTIYVGLAALVLILLFSCLGRKSSDIVGELKVVPAPQAPR